jgi:hypothetical protein
MINGVGKYIYGIIKANQKREFGPIGIGGRGDIVYTLCYQDLAAIVSSSPIVKYPVTRDNSIAHARVLETAMADYTVLPARFCTIGEEEEIIIDKVLKSRYQEFIDLIAELEGKIELGVRAFWTDMNAIFTETVEENPPIKQLKDDLIRETNIQRQYAGKIKIGQMVQKALEEKKKTEAQELLEILKPLSLDSRENHVYGDMNLVNAAFLVAKKREEEFDQKMQELEKVYGERKKLKYIGPVPPYNFVEVVVTW